ncbi:tRNA (N(6)-L-threonylcarbamoyladenosine(37)-C(2))-methylthiotransferase MtaB [Geovibrio thiophilus]|uniref:tRNA (N(6)-L-threonylcarbamoyladenosine(37)-C(2))-methylthiotransferase MtaB n=1 Tax=Geovibrio thiophilus TaxID=139438 RepID=A0A410K1J6_9BACT|nr:tRNA (N(6)-L-threonylcarbamoyladenosine(37)-C(2))-methylthiotransferase MtaB [Geovibrio thiophilus]QAR34316.1 tRNA (N(6)-L-threonylcarbamoyladenosine(37)-C(2))-methylthiotransferase MtaB [Geovibrio thiophilus]
MNIYIYTFGCKVNQVESEHLLGRAAENGLVVVSEASSADAVIINSCAVTERAVNKMLSLLRKIKKDRPEVFALVTGCAADLLTEKLKKSGTDIVVTNAGKKDAVEYLLEKRDFYSSIETRTVLDIGYTPMKSRTRAFVKIQDGCDSFCSYCIIPMLRGKPVSKPEEDVVNEVTRLVEEGHKEIVPVGIHIGKYGQDNGSSLALLLEKLVAIEGDFRIRLTSVELNELDDRLEELFRNDKICRHLHIPLQSGSSGILKKMNRHYTAEEYIEKVSAFKHKINGLTVGADVITGFPGETDAHFEECINTICSSGVDFLHVFQYSDREGTAASTMKDKIKGAVKKERAEKLRILGDRLKSEAADRCVGKSLRVLAQKGGMGITDNYFDVRMPDGCEPNRFYTMNITGRREDCVLYGDE